MKLLRDERGEFSLPGLLVAMLLFAMILGATLTLYSQFERGQRDVVERNEAQDQARQTVDRLARELRNLASPTFDRPESVDRAQPYDLIFQSVDPIGPNTGANAANVMRVRYCVTGVAANATLWRQEQRWSTQAPPVAPPDAACPGTGWAAQQVVVDHVVNRRSGLDRPVFAYNQALTTADVTSVRSDLFVDRDVARGAGETRLATGIFLRNQNRKPTAAFEAPRVTPAGIVLNGSLSSDPEGEAMKFKWYNGTQQIGDGISLTYKPPARGTLSISLRVYDPAYLEGIAPAVAVTW